MPELDPEEYDPKLVQAIQGIHKQYGEKIKKLEEMVGYVAQDAQSRQQQELTRELDSFFAGDAETHGELFGKGTCAELAKDSKEFKERQGVIAEMNSLVSGYMQTGRPVPAMKEIYRRAKLILHADYKKPEPVVPRSRDERGQFTPVARPTHRNGKPLTGEQLALVNMSNRLSEMGIGVKDDDEADGLLG
jgi:hypothetical protein